MVEETIYSLVSVDIIIDTDRGKGEIRFNYDVTDQEEQYHEAVEFKFRSNKEDHDHRIPFSYQAPDKDKPYNYTLRIIEELKEGYIYPMFGDGWLWREKIISELRGENEFFS